MGPKFNSPSKTHLNDTIKIPRRYKADAREYREFIYLGLGKIFDSNLDKVIFKEKKWIDPKSDHSDYFNYDLSNESWKSYCCRVRRFRMKELHRLTIDSYEKKLKMPQKYF